MEENVGLVILEHLSNQLDVDILDVDLLEDFSIAIQINIEEKVVPLISHSTPLWLR